MPVRAVLFDLDNTLVLEDEVTHAALRATCATASGADPERLFTVLPDIARHRWRTSPAGEWAERFGIWWGEGLWADFAGDGAEIAALRASAPGFRREVWRDALAAAGASDDALADELASTFRRIRRASEIVDPDAVSVLSDLARDHRLAIVTNGASDVQREKLARTPLVPFFGAIVISVEVGVPKPDARIFEIALERLGAKASDAAMVGDSRPRDVAGGRAAGLRTIQIERAAWSEGPGPEPDARIDRLTGVRAALRDA